MAFCAHCGAQMAGDARFCTSCGAEQQEKMPSDFPPPPPPPAKKKAPKGLKIAVGVIFAVLIILVIAIIVGSSIESNNGTASSTPKAAVTTPSAAVTSTAKPTTTTPKANWATAPLTSATATEALKGVRALMFGMDASEVKTLSATVAGDSVTVTWTPTDPPAGAKAIVSDSAYASAGVFKLLFSNPAVTYATFITNVGVVDAYGKTSTEKGVTILFSRATADKVVWSNFPGSWQNVYKIADDRGISNTVYRDLDAEYRAGIAP